MARYIDADALKLDIDLSKGASVLDMAISVIKAVQNAPTADVVPKSEVKRAVKVLAAQEIEYSQALQDKARECNMAIDKICLEHREEIRALKEKHEAELAEAKREVSNEIFAGVKLLLQNMVDKYGYKATLEPDFDQKKEYRGAQIGVSVALHSVVAYEYEVKKKYKEDQT
jgi:hypothetical protein